MRPSPLIRRRLRDDRGITLVEVVVSMALMSLVLLVFTTTMSSVQRAAVEQEVRTRLVDDARLALQSIERQVRSGNVLYDPSSETDPYGSSAGYMFRIYTQANAPSLPGYRCALWLIDDGQRLLYRWWPPLAPEDATSWRVVTEGIVNRDLSDPAFFLDPTARTMVVNLQVNPDLDERPEATQQVDTSVTGRNTSFGYPENVCEDLPPDM
jgi:type II secretory pathway pseudopilin PulG